MKKKGFTLAEVLITLAIIGVVAALTIPSAISNYQQQEFKTGLKKAVSVLNETIQTNIAQDGETPYENSDLFAYLQRHMSVLKRGEAHVCRAHSGGGIADIENGNCKGSYDDASSVSNYVFYTTDGMRFELSMQSVPSNIVLHESGLDIGNQMNAQWGGKCGSYGLKDNVNNTKNPPCVVMVDVNGDKKPNPRGILSLTRMNYVANSTTGEMYWDRERMSDGGNTAAYTYPTPNDKKINDIFNILITDEKAIPFGVVAQRAMYSK